MLESRRNELFAGKVDHDAFALGRVRAKSFGSYLVRAHLGIVDGVEEDERLTLVAVDENFLHVVALARTLEKVEQVRLFDALGDRVEPQTFGWLALAEAKLDHVVADAFAGHASHCFYHALYVAELDEGVRARAIRRLLLVVLLYFDLNDVTIFLVQLLAQVTVVDMTIQIADVESARRSRTVLV